MLQPYTREFNFQPGQRYRVVHQSPSQRYARVSVMVYLGAAGGILDYFGFSARPVAGTQQLPESWIKQVELVSSSVPVSLNKRFMEG